MKPTESKIKRSTMKMSEKTKELINCVALVIEEQRKNILQTKDGPTCRTAVDLISIIDGIVVDPRDQTKCVYKVSNVILLVYICVLNGYYNCVHMEAFIRHYEKQLVELGLLQKGVLISHDTIRRILTIIDGTSLLEAMKVILKEHFKIVNSISDVLCCDGKSFNGSDRGEKTNNPLSTIYSFNVYAAGSFLVLASVPMGSKDSEMKVAQATFPSLNIKGKIICSDALHMQKETIRIIVECGGDYLIPIKDNQPTLHSDAKLLIEDSLKSFKKTTKNYVIIKTKRLTKEIFVFSAKDLISAQEFTALHNILLYRTTNVKTGEVTDLILSTSLTGIARIAYAVSHRWAAENELHRNKDMLLDEDKLRFTNKNLLNNLAIINDYALTFIHAVNKEYKHPSLAFTAKIIRSDFFNIYKRMIRKHSIMLTQPKSK